MGDYNCTGCRVGNKFKVRVDKRGFVMNIQCTECGKITGTLDFKDTIDKRFKETTYARNETPKNKCSIGDN